MFPIDPLKLSLQMLLIVIDVITLDSKKMNIFKEFSKVVHQCK